MSYLDQIKTRFLKVQAFENPKEGRLIDQEKAKCWEGFNLFCGGACALHSREAVFYLEGTDEWIEVWEPEKNATLVFSQLTNQEAFYWFLDQSHFHDIPEQLVPLAEKLCVNDEGFNAQGPPGPVPRNRVPIYNEGADSWFDPADAELVETFEIYISSGGIGKSGNYRHNLYRLLNGKFVVCKLHKGQPLSGETVSKEEAARLLLGAGLELPPELAEIAEKWNAAKPAVLDSLIPTRPARQSCLLDIVEFAIVIAKRGRELEEKLAGCAERDPDFLRELLNRHYRKIDILDPTVSEDATRDRLNEVGLTWSKYRDLAAMDQDLRAWYDECLQLYSKLIEPETWSANTSESVRLALDWVTRCFRRATDFPFDDYPSIYPNVDTLPLAVEFFFPVGWEDQCNLGYFRQKDTIGGFDDLRTPPVINLRPGWYDLETAAVALLQTISPATGEKTEVKHEPSGSKGNDPTAFRPAKESLETEVYPGRRHGRMTVAEANEEAMRLAKGKGKSFLFLSERQQAKQIGCSWETWTKTDFYKKAKEKKASIAARITKGDSSGSARVVGLTTNLETTIGEGDRDEVLKQLISENQTEANKDPSPLEDDPPDRPRRVRTRKRL
jgi:hypothetical protein